MPGKYKSVRARDCSSSETDCLDLQSLHGPHGFPSMTHVDRITVVLRVKQPPGTKQYCMCMPSPSGEYVTSEPTADVTQMLHHDLWSIPPKHQKWQNHRKHQKRTGKHGLQTPKLQNPPRFCKKHIFAAPPQRTKSVQDNGKKGYPSKTLYGHRFMDEFV